MSACRVKLEHLASALDLLEDIAGGGGPDKRFWIPVVVRDVSLDSRNQILNAAEDAASNGLRRNITEEPFYHIEPRCAGRSEMHVKARVALESSLDLLVLMRSVVVGDEMDIKFGADARINQAEKL